VSSSVVRVGLRVRSRKSGFGSGKHS
jgi:hypothetical protein